MKRIVALSIGLWAASWAEAEEQAQRMLPLAIGNRWEYLHFRYYLYDRTFNHEELVTIGITHTEDIEGHIYYVFSDMPYEDPPVPAFFLAGKKVRWKDNHLLFRQQDEDVALYQFKHDHSYAIPGMYSDAALPSPSVSPDTLVLASKLELQMPIRKRFFFEFRGSRSRYTWGQGGLATFLWGQSALAIFVDGIGMSTCEIKGSQLWNPFGDSLPSYNDQTEGHYGLFLHSALINGVELDIYAYQETVIRASSWGVLKRKFTCPECED